MSVGIAVWVGVAFVAITLSLFLALLAVEAWREVRDRKARARRVEEQPPRVRTIIGGPDHG